MVTINEALELGLQHHQAGEMPRAEEIYRKILAHDPGQADALHLLGALTLQTGRVNEAITLLMQAVASNPAIAAYHGNCGSALLTACRYDEARSALEEALRREPDFADAHYNLGVVLYNLGRLDDSEASYRRAIELRPEDPTTHNNLGDLLRELGRYDEALEHIERALAANPDYAAAHYNRSLIWLARGQMAQGWDEYEWRWRCYQLSPGQTARPHWDGSELGARRLLVCAEQGLGDTLQFIRYLPLLKQRVANPIVEVPPSLLPLLERSGYTGLVPQRAVLPPFDVQVSMLSLSRILGVTLENIPREVPYLTARPELVESWRQKLARFAGLKVGIIWQGSTDYREDRYRSIPLAFFAPLARVPGVQLLSLQKGAGSEQISQLRARFHVVDLGSGLDEAAGPFMDTAAVMRNLDLVITSDTVAAHLAGALGVPVWLALRLSPDWRWLIERSDSPWYPTMRLFRQRAFGDWPQVFADMAEALQQIA